MEMCPSKITAQWNQTDVFVMHHPVENVTTGQPQLTEFQYYFNFCEVGFIHPMCWTQYKEGMPNWKNTHSTYRLTYGGT